MLIQSFIFAMIAIVFTGSMGLCVILPTIHWVEKSTALVWALGYLALAALAVAMTFFFPNNVTFTVVSLYYLTSFVFMVIKYAEIVSVKITKSRGIDYNLLKR